MTEDPGSQRARRIATPEQLGATLADLRRAAGMNQQELAERAGVSRQCVSVLGTGDVSLQVRRLVDLFAVLGYDLAVVPRPLPEDARAARPRRP